eukprot:TRINITY_DN4431_c0_g1_i2.p1 TRINITY_DN4431_c0_g1~~TRINITY_DN4431_c0_g1_i2.p1  ORF type:complete len:794 (+),score=158.28 TRINITY_DN4431_c0_g1_i2:43-2424(+)
MRRTNTTTQPHTDSSFSSPSPSSPSSPSPSPSPSSSPSSTPQELIVSAAIFAAAASVYLSTRYAHLPGGDGSELITAGVTWGCAHPPGYPLFTLLMALVCRDANCANAVNAVIAAAAVAVIAYAALWHLSRFHRMQSGAIGKASVSQGAKNMTCSSSAQTATAAKEARKKTSVQAASMMSSFAMMGSGGVDFQNAAFAAVVASLLFAWSHDIWMYAIGGEVFALNNLLNAVLLLAVAKFHFEFQVDAQDLTLLLRNALSVAFFSALSLTNQHTSVFPVFVYALSVMFRPCITATRKTPFTQVYPLWTTRNVVLLSSAVLLGMSFYVYLPIVALSRPITCWGAPWSWANFWRLFLRADYGTFQLSSEGEGGFSSFVKRLILYFTNTTSELLYIGALAAVFGLFVLLKSKNKNERTIGQVTLAAHSFYIVTFCYLANLPLEDALHLGVQLRFFPQAVVIVTFWSVIGFAYFFQRLWWSKYPSILLVAFQIYLNYTKLDMSQNFHFKQYGLAVMNALPKDALVLCRGDLAINTMRYLQDVDGYRTDLVILDQEIMTWDWFLEMHRETFSRVHFPGLYYHPHHAGSYNLSSFFAHNMDRFPSGIFIHGGLKPGDSSYSQTYKTVPYGLSDRVYPMDYDLDIETYMQESDLAMPTSEIMPLPDPIKYDGETWENTIAVKYYEAWHNRGLFLLNVGIQKSDRIAYQHSVRVLQALADTQSSPGPWVYRNLGIAYSRLLLWTDFPAEVIDSYLEGVVKAWSTYLVDFPQEDSSRQEIANAVSQYQQILSARKRDNGAASK